MLKAYNLVKKQPVPKRKEDGQEPIIKWETDGASGLNNFPQQLLQNVYNSPAASAAIDIWQEFVEGGGFADPKLETLQTSAKETLPILHASLSSDLSSMWGLAVLVNYDSQGIARSWRHLPFEGCRLGTLNDEGETDRIYYNPYYGTTDWSSRFTKWYYSYNNDPAFVKQQIQDHAVLRAEKKVEGEYQGQVYWFSMERPMARVYPQPFYYSAINWFQVDAKIQEYHARNIDNNFLLSVSMDKYGDPDAPSGPTDKDGNQHSTVGEDFAEEMSSFSGSENGGSVLVNWFTNKDQKSEVTAFPTNANDELFTKLQDIVSGQISIGMKTPRVLMGIGEAGKLGDTQEILNAVRVMQARTKRMRETLSRIYKELFIEGDFTIKNVNPINVLPDWVVSAMGSEDKIKYINEHFNLNLTGISEEIPESKNTETGKPKEGE